MFPPVGHDPVGFGVTIDKSSRLSQAPVIPKSSAEDALIVVGNGAGDTTTFQIPAGSEITIDTAGLHYNREISFQIRSDDLRTVT